MIVIEIDMIMTVNMFCTHYNYNILKINDKVRSTSILQNRKFRIGVAMGSGGEEIKDMTGLITYDVDKDGLYEAFVKFKLI